MSKERGPLAILTANEMMEVVSLTADEKKDLIIAGYIDFPNEQLILFRGNGMSLVAPMNMFTDRPTQPDFDNFSIIDHGLTLKFGEFEAAVDYVLYELDPEYKLKADANRLTN